MPASYTARKQSLYGQMGAPNAPTGGVDIAGAIDALSGGAQSLIHSAMLRQQNERAMAQAAEDRAYQRSRDEAEDKRRDREDAFKRKESDRDFMLKGGVPEHDEMQPTPTMADVAMPQPQPRSPIQKAMTKTPGLPAPSYTPSAVRDLPSRAPLPASKLQTTTVPESVDYRRSTSYQQATDVARVRGEVSGELAAERASEQAKQLERKITAQKEAAVFAQRGRIELEKLRQAGQGNGIRRGMTANAVSNLASSTADGLLSSFNGDRQAAYEWLNSDDDDAKALRELDLAIPWGTYLDNARAKWGKTATSQALSFQRGPMGDEPAEAAKKVETTRNIVVPPRINRGAPAAPAVKLPAGAESMALPSAMDPMSVFRKSPPAAGKKAKPAPAPADTVMDDEITEEEIDAAIKAGYETEADVKAFAIAQRKNSKKKG